MIKLKLIKPEETMHQDKYLFSLSIDDFRRNKKFHRLDVKTMVEDVWDLSFLKDKEFNDPYIAQLPNNELLVFGTSWEKKIACIIDCSTLKIRKLLNWNHHRSQILGIYCNILGISYRKNSIYIFGQFWKYSYPLLWNYNLLNGKYAILANFPIKLEPFYYYSICFEEKLILGLSYRYIYVYDFYSNSYSQVEVSDNFEEKYILIPGKTNLYYISVRYIFESGHKNPYLWKKIGKVNLENTRCIKSWACYNDYIFIREAKIDLYNTKRSIDNIYYEFSLAKKSLKRKKISKNNCRVF